MPRPKMRDGTVPRMDWRCPVGAGHDGEEGRTGHDGEEGRTGNDGEVVSRE